MNIPSVIYRYLLFAAVIALLPVALMVTGNSNYIFPRFWILFGYISALTLMVIVLVSIVQKKNAELYAQAFLAGTTVKILGCLFFILILLHKAPVNKFIFAIDFCYIYFLNIAFEVYYLLRNLRNQNLR